MSRYFARFKRWGRLAEADVEVISHSKFDGLDGWVFFFDHSQDEVTLVMTTVLKQLSQMKRFSIFEATANDHIARMMDKLVKEKYIEVDNSMGYPWSGVKLTQKGLEHIGAPTKWRSIAVWPDTIKVGNEVGKNESDDTHDSREAAQAVCDLLQKHGFGGDGKVFPISTRVEPA